MELTPDDIVNYPLTRRRMGGYEIDEVDDLLDQVATTLERLQHDLDDTRRRLESAEERLETSADLEAQLARTLTTAQRSAEQTVADAEREATELLDAAKQDADTTRDEATRDAERLREETLRDARETERAARGRIAELQAGVDELETFERDVRVRLRDELERHLRVLDEVGATVVAGSRPELSDFPTGDLFDEDVWRESVDEDAAPDRDTAEAMSDA